MVPFDSEMDTANKVSADEFNDRRQSASSSVFRTPLQKSGSADAASLKSTPADPHLTETNGQSTSLRKYEESSDKRSTREQLSDIIIQDQSSMDSQSLSLHLNGNHTVNHSRSQSRSTILSNTKDESKPGPEPEILAHRRENSGTITVSQLKPKNELPVGKPSVSLSQLDSFDPKRYVNEFYADTRYRFATDKRNEDFHALFPKSPKSERLLDDFSCALNREFLIQGRVYITPERVYFHSNLLGWVTSLDIEMRDIVTLEKISTAGLFPNGICIHLANEKHYFASFISRDATFKFLEIIWHTRKELDYLTLKPEQLALNHSRSLNDFLTGTTSTCPPSRSSFADDGDTIESAIMSVDDDFPVNRSLTSLNENPERNFANDTDEYASEDQFDEEDEDEEEDEDDEMNINVTSNDKYATLLYDEEAVASDAEDKSLRKVFKLKKKSKFHYSGPYYFKATEFMYNPEDNKETVLAELDLKAPPGVVYQLMFSEDCPDFLITFLKAQDSSQISEIPPFDKANPEGQHYREYSYAKALSYPVGPKSTKCLVSEHILYCAYDNYINIVNTTKTPDVPSGNNFSVKTRYLYRWKDSTSCVLKISYWVEWTGSSWIKSMIDNSVKSGQAEATKRLVELIHEFVNNNVEEVEMRVNTQPRRGSPQSRRVSKMSSKPVLPPVEKSELQTVLEKDIKSTLTKDNAILVLLVFITFLLIFNTTCQVRIIRKLNKLMNTGSISVVDEIKDILSVYNELPILQED